MAKVDPRVAKLFQVIGALYVEKVLADEEIEAIHDKLVDLEAKAAASASDGDDDRPS